MKNQYRVRIVGLGLLLLLSACGGGGGDGKPPTADRTPDEFSFAAVDNAEPGVFQDSSITISGLDDGERVPANLGNIAAGSFELLINHEKQDNHLNREVRNGDVVTIRLQSSEEPEGQVSAEFFAGDAPQVSAVFEVTTKSDAEPPELAVHFPPPFSLSNQFEFTARGTVEDAFGIAKLEVAGTEVEVHEANGEWTATLSLLAGANAIEVVATDLSGNRSTAVFNVDTTATEIGEGDVWFAPQQMVFDPARNTLFAASYGDGLLALDVTTGERREVSGPNIGAGTPFGNLRGVAFSGDPERLFVSDSSTAAIFSVDIVSGDRAIVSDKAGTGAGPDLASPFGLAHAAETGQLFTALNGNDTVLAIDPSTGNRSAIGTVGSLHGTIAVRHDVSSLFVIDNVTDQVMEMQLDGSTDVISDGEGAVVNTPYDLALHGDALYVSDHDTLAPALIRLDLTDKRKHVVADQQTGRGPALAKPDALALDPERSIVFLHDGTRVLAVDLVNGERVTISSQ